MNIISECAHHLLLNHYRKWNKRDAKKYTKWLAKEAHLEQTKRDLWNDEATLPFFLYRLHFNDVFANKGGFDVAVANPPYVRGELLAEQKPEFKASFPNVYAGSADLYVYFFARAFDILQEKGQISFITSNKYLRSKYGTKLRGFLSRQVKLNTIIDFDDLPVFDAAAYPCIIVGQRSTHDKNQVTAVSVNDMDAFLDLHKTLETKSSQFFQARLSEQSWEIVGADAYKVMQKLKGHKTIKDIFGGSMYRGIVTGANSAFVIDEETYGYLLDADPNNREVMKSWLRGKDISRWQITPSKEYLIFTRQGIEIEKYPLIKEYLHQFYDDLVPKKSKDDERGRKIGTYKWFEIQDTTAYYPELEKIKIVWGNLGIKPQFTLDKSKSYLSAPANLISGELSDMMYLLGLLNSSVSYWFFHLTAATRQGGYVEYKPMYVNKFPIPNAPEALRQQIASLARECLDVAKDNPDKLPELEKQLNELVYQAYGLNEDDIAVIEGHLGK